MANRPKSLKYPRTHAFYSQHGKCFYCNQPLWKESPIELTSRYPISSGKAKLLQCTGEHLVPHSEGGPASTANTVAACWYCNRKRHARKKVLSPERFREFVRKRLSIGVWHGLNIAT
jgi:5-methylcytosine-specific restriction endonuclease McrA